MVNKLIDFNYFKSSKIFGLKDSAYLAISLRYSKFRGISPTVSRLLRYESVLKGAVPHTGQKVILSILIFGDNNFQKFQAGQKISTNKIMHCKICQKFFLYLTEYPHQVRKC